MKVDDVSDKLQEALTAYTIRTRPLGINYGVDRLYAK